METRVNYLKLRSSIYKILSMPFFKEPDADDIEKLNRYALVLTEIATQSECDAFVRAVKILVTYIAKTDHDYDKLATEFARLFLGVNKATANGHTVTPHESVYLSSSRLVMQEPRDEVLKIYCDEGVKKDDSFKEPEDHITAEMGFIAYMSDKAAKMLESGDEDGYRKAMSIQADFLDQHLCLWVHELVADIRQSTTMQYYILYAGVVQEFLLYDHKLLIGIVNLV